MIVFVHLLNDYSGSPRVLASSINYLSSIGEEACLFVGAEGGGILDTVNVEKKFFWYKRGKNNFQKFCFYFFSQVLLFLKLLQQKNISNKSIIYVNTLLPFGAAVFGLLTGRKVLYHLHEVSVRPSLLKNFLIFIASIAADKIIFVSDAHSRLLPVKGVPFDIIHNSLSDDFLRNACLSEYQVYYKNKFVVLMLTYIRDYKGVPEFFEIAKKLICKNNVVFHLVASDRDSCSRNMLDDFYIPSNVSIFSSTLNPEMYYKNASLVVNLTRPDLCVETFGLTLLESMAYGIPVIAPPVGGPSELVTDGIDGFLLDSRDTDSIVSAINILADDINLCKKMSSAARCKALKYSEKNFSNKINEVFKNLHKSE